MTSILPHSDFCFWDCSGTKKKNEVTTNNVFFWIFIDQNGGWLPSYPERNVFRKGKHAWLKGLESNVFVIVQKRRQFLSRILILEEWNTFKM